MTVIYILGGIGIVVALVQSSRQKASQRRSQDVARGIQQAQPPQTREYKG